MGGINQQLIAVEFQREWALAHQPRASCTLHRQEGRDYHPSMCAQDTGIGRSPFITSIFLSQALELGNKDDKVDNKDKYKQEQFDNTSDNTSDGTDDSGDNIRHDKR